MKIIYKGKQVAETNLVGSHLKQSFIFPKKKHHGEIWTVKFNYASVDLVKGELTIEPSEFSHKWIVKYVTDRYGKRAIYSKEHKLSMSTLKRLTRDRELWEKSVVK